MYLYVLLKKQHLGEIIFCIEKFDLTDENQLRVVLKSVCLLNLYQLKNRN